MKRVHRLCFLAFFLAAVSSSSYAGYQYRFDERMNQDGQLESEIAAKLSRGITNTIYGWTEAARTPARWADNIHRGVLQAVTIGIPYGIFRAVGRTVTGVYEIATCYAPQKPIFSDLQGDVS
jgi:putative exosortase-associated protein (TIGR04073 family)